MSDKSKVPEPLQRQGDPVEKRTHHPTSQSDNTPAGAACQYPLTIQPARGGAVFRVSGRICGQLQNGVLRKTVRASRHLYRTRNAYCWSVAVLRAASDMGALEVQIHDSESGNTWRASLAEMRAKGFPLSESRGEPQWGLCLQDYHLVSGSPNPFAPADTDPQQLRLLGA